MKKIVSIFSWTTLLLLASFIFVGTNQASAKEFKDVPKSHPNYEAIQAMQKAGYIGGYPDGTFRPNEKISRKHVAQLLEKAVKLPGLSSSKVIYTDVPKSHPYYTPIMKLSQAGIVGGSNGKFNPNSTITRIQMAKVLDLAFDLHMGPYQRPFEDVNSNHWGYPHASAMYSSGVSKGDNGKFYPSRPVTRAHYAEFLQRAINVTKSRPNTTAVTKGKAVDLSYRLPHIIEGIILEGKYKKKSFNTIRPQLLQYVTKEFADTKLKNYYPHACTECDSFYFPYYVDTSIRFSFNQPNSNAVNVKTVEFSDGLSGGGFVDYKFIKESGTWKMANYTYEMVGKRHLQLTVNEAQTILKQDYQDYGHRNVTVSYVSTVRDTAHDYKADQKYSYDKYVFRVETNKGRFKVSFQSNDGMHYED